MFKKLQVVFFAAVLVTTSFFCKITHTNKGIRSSKSIGCCIDTFKLKYSIALSKSKVKWVDENIYVGILKDTILVENRAYRKLIFGDTDGDIITLVRQDDEALNYIEVSNMGTKEEKPLLFFTKKVNEKWKVHIDDSYFWRKEITFAGIEHIENDEVFIYNIETEKGYTSLGNELSKLYYSKENGFLKLVIKTHWISVEVKKSK